ncbi:hypothetical protein Hanom_Chr01g00009591 [Helianthus anomalus]
MYSVECRYARGRCCLQEIDTGVAVIHVFAMNGLIFFIYIAMRRERLLL